MLLDRIQKGDNLVRDCQESIQLSGAYATKQAKEEEKQKERRWACLHRLEKRG
jgi:hypothetical protein